MVKLLLLAAFTCRPASAAAPRVLPHGQAVVPSVTAPAVLTGGFLAPSFSPSTSLTLEVPSLVPTPQSSLLFAPESLPSVPLVVPAAKPKADNSVEEEASLGARSLFDFARKLTGLAEFRKSRSGAVNLEKTRKLLGKHGIETQYWTGAEDEYSEAAAFILPRRDASPLNRFADDVSEKLGVSLEYIPQRVGEVGEKKPIATFNRRDDAIYLPHLDRPDFYSATLHEVRHAYFKRLQGDGDYRVFHMIVGPSKRGGDLGAGMKYYNEGFSLEELSNYPKTFRHIVQALENGVPMHHPKTSIDAFRDVLKATALVAKWMEPKRNFLGRPLSSMRAFTNNFSVDLQNDVTLLVAAQDRLHADRDLAARRPLLAAYVKKVSPLLEAYAKALRKGDLAKAKSAANKMIAAATEMDKRFLAQRDLPLEDD